jgi:putative hydrolase of the HAD superfamily
MHAALSHVETWIFDLDNTLYPASTNLFALIDVRMGEYIMRLTGCERDEARRIQKQYFHAHGTTMAGLMRDHEVDPHDFLDFVHDIDMSGISPNEELVAALARLPGRKLVFTNGDAPYAGRVLDRLGLGESFEAVHDIHATAYRPKPDPQAYQGLCDAYGIDPARALFAEDMVRNLAPAKAIGMTTVWVDNGSEQAPGDADTGFVDYRTHDIGHWLLEMMEDA